MRNLRKTIVFIGDMAALAVSFVATIFIAFGPQVVPELVAAHLIPFGILYISWVLILYIFDLYESTYLRPTTETIKQTVYGLTAMLLFGIVFFYLTPLFDITPKTNLFLNVGLFGALFLGWRRLLASLFVNKFRVRVGFIGEEAGILKLVSKLQDSSYRGYDVAFHATEEEFKTLEKHIYKSADIIVVPEKISSESLQRIYRTNAAIMDIGEAYERIMNIIPVDIVDEIWFLHKLHTKTGQLYEIISLAYSKLGALIILLLTSPIWILAPIIIKIQDGGPVFYKQKRVGKQGNIFSLIKFRSMRTDAEKDGARWAAEKDNRITPFGKFLRKSHLDEIPQMLNILRGDILLVGPRPERPEFVETLENEIPHYELRHIIHPGFTGWAQIRFRYARSKTDSKEKLEYDLFYVKNRNLALDIGIILKTIQIIVKH